MVPAEAGARAAFTAARAEQQKTLQAPESYGPALCVLGLIDAGLGRKEEALRHGRRDGVIRPAARPPPRRGLARGPADGTLPSALRTQSPLLPPVFETSRTDRISTPFSTAAGRADSAVVFVDDKEFSGYSWLDGAIARLTHTKTTLGAYLDPAADKLLLLSAFIALGFMHAVPRWLAVVVISRDVVIVLGYFLLFMLTQRTMQVQPSVFGKLSTFLQLTAVDQITVFGVPEDKDLIKRYGDAGVARLVFNLNPAKADEVLPALDRFAGLMR